MMVGKRKVFVFRFLGSVKQAYMHIVMIRHGLGFGYMIICLVYSLTCMVVGVFAVAVWDV